MKKFISLIILIILLGSIFTLPATAAGSGVLALSNAEGKQGDTVTVNVNLDSNPGLITMKFTVSWGEGLELTNVSNSGLLAGWTTPAPTINSPYTLRWADSLATKNNTKTGKIATLTFKIKDNATVGNKTVALTFSESRNTTGGRNTFGNATASIKVNCKTHTYKTTTTKATLTKNGSIVKKCTVCGKEANTSIKYAKTFNLSTTAYTYNGAVKTPIVTVKDSAGKTLKQNVDYTVAYASGRKNAGTYKITVKMKGNYTGTKTLTFKINPAKLSSYKLSATTYTYNGKVKKPTVTVKNSNGTKLTTSSYTVAYPSGRKNVGTYKVTIKGKNNYTGTKSLTFKINPPKTTVSKLSAGKKSMTVAIAKKSTQVTGYQIQYSTSKSFSKATTKTISSYKTTKYTLKRLSAKKTYYVRVRTYKKIGNTKYYSDWSTYKRAKTK